MKRYRAATMARLFVCIFCIPVFSLAQEKEMRVLKVKEDKCVAYVGGIKGIKENASYSIVRDNKSIGKAQVIAVENDICGLLITEVKSGYVVDIGDYLKPDLDTAKSKSAAVVKNGEDLASKELTGAKKVYFLDGENKAVNEYNGNNALAGGFLSGSLLNVIGWGAGYAFLSTRTLQVPQGHIANLDEKQKHEFTAGYKQTVDKKRKRKYHIGAAVGTVISTAIIVTAVSR
ncbi:MAG: hypothetical protein H6696_03930 [Deferribacteres bacterium]|nr:hypothetical protein [candidate division KSB1 bacterium]MCB9501062.1 hypothetical protein [Deferribacteres bacterium]